jgi:serine/threonine protein kinase
MSNEPSQVGSCEITQTFGSDALGSVNLARHTPTGKLALMRILSEEICADASFRDRFLLEAKSASRLQHDNIARLLDSGGVGNRLYFASEFHGGESLLGMAQRRARSEATSLKIALCIADALRFAWEKEQLVHRGLSLANVLIGDDGVPRIYELGMAKPSGGVFGDIRFAAPEQLMGKSATDHRLDMFSLGMILHSLITGKLPPAVTIPAALKMSDPRTVNPNLTITTCRILEKLLAREATHRYRGWEEVSRDITRALRGEDAKGEPPPSGASVLVFNTPLPQPTANEAVAAAVEPAVVELKTSDAPSKPAPPPKPAESVAEKDREMPQAQPSFVKKYAPAVLIGATAVIVVVTAIVLYRHFTHDPLDDLIKSRGKPTQQEQEQEKPPEEKPLERKPPVKAEAPPPVEPPPSAPEPAVKNPAKELADIRGFASSNPNAHAELIERLRRFLDEFPDAAEAGVARSMLESAEAKLAAQQAEEQRQREAEEARRQAEAERKAAEERAQAELKRQQEEAAARAKEEFPKFLDQFSAALSQRNFSVALGLAQGRLEDPEFESFKPQLTALAAAAERLKNFWDELPAQLGRLKGRTVTVGGVTGKIGEVTAQELVVEREGGSVGMSFADAAAGDVIALASLFIAADSTDGAVTKAWFFFADGKHTEASAFLDAAQKLGANADEERGVMGSLSAQFREADAERQLARLRSAMSAQDWSAARASLNLLKANYAQTRAGQTAQRDLAAMEGMLTYYEDIARLPAASVLRTYQHPAPVTSVAFHPRGRIVASASQGIVRLWDMVTNQVTREIDTGFASGIASVTILPSGRLMVVMSADAKSLVKVFDISSGRETASYNPNASSLVMSPDGRFLYGLADGYPKLWHLETGEAVKEFGSGPWGVHFGVFTPDSQFVVSVLRVNDQIFRWHELPSGKVAGELKSIKQPVSTLTVANDGKTLLAVTNDGAFKVCARGSEEEPRSFGEGVNAHAGVALSGDGRYVAAAVDGGRIKLWNIATGRAMRLFQGHSGTVRSVAYSPDQRFIVSGSDDKTLRIWKLWDGDGLPAAPRPATAAPR